jgi:hypothetical protein
MFVVGVQMNSGVPNDNIRYAQTDQLSTVFVDSSDQSFGVLCCTEQGNETHDQLVLTLTHHIGMLPTDSVGKNWLQDILNKL